MKSYLLWRDFGALGVMGAEYRNALGPVSMVEFTAHSLTARHMEARRTIGHVAFDDETATFDRFEFAKWLAIGALVLLGRALE